MRKRNINRPFFKEDNGSQSRSERMKDDKMNIRI